MGGWARDYRRRFPAGCLSRSTVDRCAYTDSDTHCDSDRNAHSYAYIHRDAYTDASRNAHPDCDAHGYGYTYTHAGPNHSACDWLSGKRATESGPVLEWRDFESCRRLPQRRFDRHDQE